MSSNFSNFFDLQIESAHHQVGTALHGIGDPLGQETYFKAAASITNHQPMTRGKVSDSSVKGSAAHSGSVEPRH